MFGEKIKKEKIKKKMKEKGKTERKGEQVMERLK